MADPRHPIERDPLFSARYALDDLLGVGGSARVFRGTQLSTGQSVAVKIHEAPGEGDRPASEAHAARFRREIELCAGLHHPHVVRLIDAGTSESGSIYTVFDYLPGRSLDRVLSEEGRLEPGEATRIMGQVLDAIACAHRQGVVHRDLKPSNVMISETGVQRNAFVLDFGIGVLAEEMRDREPAAAARRETVGTPSYASPEQLRGEPATPRSDLYSWGLIALECLTGERPIRGATLQDILHHQLGPEPVEVPGFVRALPIGRAITASVAKLAEERPASAAQLMRWLSGGGPVASGGAPAEGSPRERRRQLTVLSLRASCPSGEGDAKLRDERSRRLRQSVLAAVRRYGGVPVATVGSRVVAVFGYPRAREEAARAALRAAAEVREEAERALGRGAAVALRAGIHSGSLLAPDAGSLPSHWDPQGAVIDTAMDLEAHAPDGEIRLTGATRGLLRGEATLEPVGRLALEGEAAPTPVYRLVTGAVELRRAGPWIAPTPLIGRDEEQARLAAGWERVREGVPRAFLVSGEAGIGKSRLIRELRHRLDSATWIECRCAPETRHSPFQPIVDWLAAWLRDEPLEHMLERLGADPHELYTLIADLVGLPPDPRFPGRPLSPERKRELTLRGILRLLFAAARSEPLVFVVEDLHWSDPSTIELLSLMIQEVRSAAIFQAAPELPLLVLLSARPEFQAPWSLPEVPLVQLARLARPEAESLARAASVGAAAFSDEVLDLVVRRADGVPLYLEEMGRMAAELQTAGGAEAAGSVAQEVPATLRDLLSARIDRLHEDVRRTAQTAACLGRDFDFALLKDVAGRREPLLRDDLDALLRAGLVLRRSRPEGERYFFHHALLRDSAHESMLGDERKAVHLRIARRLQEKGSEEVATQQPERLAYHCEEAGLVDAAIDFRRRAGHRAVAGSAHREAIHHYERALALMRSLPEGVERDELELALQLSIGNTTIVTHGYAAEPVVRAFERASEICNRFAETPRLFSALNGLWGYHLVRGDTEATRRLVERQRELAERSGQSAQLLAALHAAGTTAFYSGDFAAALPLLEETTRLYEQVWEARMAAGTARPLRTPATSAPMYLGWCLHLVGRAEQGLRRQMDALERAERLREAYVHVEAMTHVVALLHDRREPERTHELSDRIIAMSEDLGFRFWLGIGKSARGWARSQLGEVDAGIAEIQEGLEIFQRTASMVPLVYRLSYLAEAYLLAGRTREGLAVVEDAFARSQGHFDRFYDAEMLRLHGELLLQEEKSPASAEPKLLQALALARGSGARLLELRAAVSLARARLGSGRAQAARAVLEPVYRAFGEGLMTPDLQDAAQVMAETGA